MDNIADKLKSIEDSLVESMRIFNYSKNFFTKMKQISNNRNEEYDFHMYDDLDVFEKCADENILENDNSNIDNKLELNRIDIILSKELKKLDSTRSLMFDQYVLHMQDMSREINAVHSVIKFVKHWNKKIEDDFKLREYPELFLKCFNKIPKDIRPKIGEILSGLKHISSDLSSTQNVLNESNRINQLDSSSLLSGIIQNQREIGSTIEPGKPDLSYESLILSPDLQRKISMKKLNYKRGNADEEYSVLDYTWRPRKLRVLASSDNRLINRDLEMNSHRNEKVFELNENEDGLDESVLSDNPLNQAVHEEDDEYVNKCELPSFLNDSDRIPEIEHITTGDESYSRFYMSRVLNMTGLDRSIQEASTAMYNDDSICDVPMDNSFSRHKRELEESVQNIHFSQYDFNNSAMGPLNLD